MWDAEARTITCLACAGSEPGTVVGPLGPDSDASVEAAAARLERGVPGQSARRKYERLRDAREQRVRQKLGRLGGVYLALSSEPQSTVAWGRGSYARPFLLDGVWIGWGKALAEQLLAPGELAPAHLMALATRVADALPQA